MVEGRKTKTNGLQDHAHRLLWAALSMTIRATVAVTMFTVSILSGCGAAAVKDVGGRKFALSGKEVSIAEPFERDEPRGAPADHLCTYWTYRVAHAEGSHTIGVLSWPASYFNTLREWVDAKKNLHCTSAKRIQEKAERERDEKREEERRIREEVELRRADKDARAQIAKEIETGRCATEHVETFRSAISNTKQALNGGSSGSVWDLVDYRFVVPEGAIPAERKPGEITLSLKSAISGEIHIVLVGVERNARLEVTGGDGYPVTNESPAGNVASSLLMRPAPSRMLEARNDETISFKARGFGCMAVMIFRKF